MNTIPDTPTGFFTLLMAGTGVVFGFCCVWLTDRIVEVWQARTGQPISETKRRWLSIAMPVVLVFIGYGGLVGLGSLPLTQETFYGACINAVAAVGAKQTMYAVVESARKPAVTVTNIGTVTATRDVYVGSTRTEDDDPLHGGTC